MADDIAPGSTLAPTLATHIRLSASGDTESPTSSFDDPSSPRDAEQRISRWNVFGNWKIEIADLDRDPPFPTLPSVPHGVPVRCKDQITNGLSSNIPTPDPGYPAAQYPQWIRRASYV
ncbi:MAG: hypothetical protein QM658_04970 [Gordonia sp. (in: high G+C Gram-positive bacteria)]